jgi:hypothetical protein
MGIMLALVVMPELQPWAVAWEFPYQTVKQIENCEEIRK